MDEWMILKNGCCAFIISLNYNLCVSDKEFIALGSVYSCSDFFACAVFVLTFCILMLNFEVKKQFMSLAYENRKCSKKRTDLLSFFISKVAN